MSWVVQEYGSVGTGNSLHGKQRHMDGSGDEEGPLFTEWRRLNYLYPRLFTKLIQYAYLLQTNLGSQLIRRVNGQPQATAYPSHLRLEGTTWRLPSYRLNFLD